LLAPSKISGKQDWGSLAHILLRAAVVSHPGAAHRSVEIFVMDTPEAALALGAHRPTAESTHILCRHVDEPPLEFTTRVLRRIDRIQKSRHIRSLWYLLGSEAIETLGSMPLLQSLFGMLTSGSSLTVVGPGSHQETVLEWLDSLVHRRRAGVTLQARLYSGSRLTETGHNFGRAQHDTPGRTLRAVPRDSRLRLAEPELRSWPDPELAAPQHALADSA
jgi:hypothetical protein